MRSLQLLGAVLLPPGEGLPSGAERKRLGEPLPPPSPPAGAAGPFHAAVTLHLPGVTSQSWPWSLQHPENASPPTPAHNSANKTFVCGTFFFFFKEKKMYWNGRVMGEEGVGALPRAGLLPMYLEQPAMELCPSLPLGCRGPSNGPPCAAFPGALAGSWIRSGKARTRTGAPMGDASACKQWPNLLCHTLACVELKPSTVRVCRPPWRGLVLLSH